jgi:hypothetical protein
VAVWARERGQRALTRRTTICRTGATNGALVNANHSATSVEMNCRGKLDKSRCSYVLTECKHMVWRNTNPKSAP